MQIDESHVDAASLAAFGIDATSLLLAGDFSTLGHRFGYARAFDREPAGAIREDLASSLAEVGAFALVSTERQSPRVSYFKPNDTGLFALVECLVPADSGKAILLELIVTTNGTSTHITLEDLSGAASSNMSVNSDALAAGLRLPMVRRLGS